MSEWNLAVAIDDTHTALADTLRRIGLLSIVVAVAACSPSYAYVPDANATATVAGRTAADYPIPPEAPRGDVRVASFGFADLVSSPDSDQLRALHLRMVIANNSDKEWSLDTREQRLDLNGGGVSSPGFASANAGTPPPVVTIAPAGKRVVDLFFPLPADQQRASKVPDFDAVWTVHADDRVVTERVPFSRIVVEPEPTPYEDYGPNYWWGPPYYYDGAYVAFGGVNPLGVRWREYGPRNVYAHGFRYERGFHGDRRR